MADSPCNAYELNQAFLDAAEFMDRVILDRSKMQRRLYFDIIPRGAYPLGEGIVRKTHRFYGGLGDQAALTTWSPVQISREASGADPGYDACRYQSEVIDYGFETLQYTGFETSRRTKDICLKDIKYKWEFQQQLSLIFGFLADITLSIWENFGREMYLRYAGAENQIYVITEGSPNTLPITSTYDPFTSDEITISRDIDISTLDWSYMEWWHQYLTLQAPQSALGQDDAGGLLWGLAVHPKDFDYMIRNNADIREDFRYASPNVLIKNYGNVKSFKGFSLTHDLLAPRFRVKSVATSTMVLERVLPFTTEATTDETKPVVNADYLNAEYAIGVILLKDVYQILIPPAGPAAPGGGTQFGAVPSLNGEFTWLNIQDRCENPLREKGYYFARFEGFSKPLQYSDEAIAFLYKRCPQTQIQLCVPCDDQEASTTWVTISAATEIVNAELGESAGAATQVEITLASCLGCEAPAELGIDYDGTGGADVTAVLTDDSEAPTYRIAFETAGDYVAGGTIVAGTSTVLCG